MFIHNIRIIAISDTLLIFDLHGSIIRGHYRILVQTAIYFVEIFELNKLVPQ